MNTNKLNTILTALLSLVLFVFNMNGAGIEMSADDVMTDVMTKTGLPLISFLVFKFASPVWKIVAKVKAGTFVWKDRNMFIHISSFLAMVVGLYVNDAALLGLLTAFILEGVNYIWHLVKPSVPVVQMTNKRAA